MAKKTRTINGWAYTLEDIDALHGFAAEDGYAHTLFAKQEDANRQRPLKRMTLTITIEDYKPKRNK